MSSVPPRPLVRYDAWSRRSGSVPFCASDTFVSRDLDLAAACARDPSAARARCAPRRPRRATARSAEPSRPARDARTSSRRDWDRDHDAEVVLGLTDQRLRDDQRLTPLRHFGLRRHEIERRRLADVHPRAVVALELERQVERALLHRRRWRAPARGPSRRARRSPRPSSPAPAARCRRSARIRAPRRPAPCA